MRQYIVDAFTDRPFHGNPAAVCVMDEWPDEQLMKSIALENNLSETAFIVKEPDGYHLKWFTPECEVGLCGHGTLASGFTILNFFEPKAGKVSFITQSGELTVSRKEELYEILLPQIELQKVEITKEIIQNLGLLPVDVVMGKDLDLICVLKDARQILNFTPDAEALKNLPGRMVHITAQGIDRYDCYSRSFGPKIGILEDPVCGSAHCQIIPYWANRIGKKTIKAWQASARGGSLIGVISGRDKLIIRGKAVLFAKSDIAL